MTPVAANNIYCSCSLRRTNAAKRRPNDGKARHGTGRHCNYVYYHLPKGSPESRFKSSSIYGCPESIFCALNRSPPLSKEIKINIARRVHRLQESRGCPSNEVFSKMVRTCSTEFVDKHKLIVEILQGTLFIYHCIS